MGTANSSRKTKERAKTLASQIGTNHLDITIDDAVDANLAIFAQVSTFLGVVRSITTQVQDRNVQSKLQAILEIRFCEKDFWADWRNLDPLKINCFVIQYTVTTICPSPL